MIWEYQVYRISKFNVEEIMDTEKKTLSNETSEKLRKLLGSFSTPGYVLDMYSLCIKEKLNNTNKAN